MNIRISCAPARAKKLHLSVCSLSFLSWCRGVDNITRLLYRLLLPAPAPIITAPSLTSNNKRKYKILTFSIEARSQW